ncbi:hypothetical protein LF1_22210 [Rubripirellula obstinata]|uniref:Uncharacterized protein n=2 Tax=Rubripirellula obstinata TaxID=406547 RepID=A0A5B1CGK2_9BACT|nr:hypothetical protein LF1_22210 [Rubripirellula obstinata]
MPARLNNLEPFTELGSAWADENAVGDVIREPVEHCKLQNEHCKLKILGKRYSLVNLHFSVFILQFAINTEAGQPQIPKAIQFPSTQGFSSAQASPRASCRMDARGDARAVKQF